MTIYGKVIDLDSNVVAGAQVKIGWRSASMFVGINDPGQESVVTSDENGLWSLNIKKPFNASVSGAVKTGYEYVYTRESSRSLVEKKATKEAPVLVTLRKKGETTFLIKREGEQIIRVFAPNARTNYVHLFPEKVYGRGDISYADLRVVAAYGGATGKWTISFCTTNAFDDFVVSPDILYQAPKDGYQKEVVCYGPPWPRFLYLRSRNPSIYSRIEWEYYPFKSDSEQLLHINYEAWVNPYGEKNFEYDAAFDLLSHQLDVEATEAIRQNKRPPKPDHPK